MMESGDQFGVGAVFQEYGEHLAAEGEVKELLRGTTRSEPDMINRFLNFAILGN